MVETSWCDDRCWYTYQQNGTCIEEGKISYKHLMNQKMNQKFEVRTLPLFEKSSNFNIISPQIFYIFIWNKTLTKCARNPPEKGGKNSFWGRMECIDFSSLLRKMEKTYFRKISYSFDIFLDSLNSLDQNWRKIRIMRLSSIYAILIKTHGYKRQILN